MCNREIKVSVICLAYNHEKYIRETLEGFIFQKTNFAFEVIIHDDASTDSTAAIIREYVKKYPDIIIPIFQSENQYSQKTPIMRTYIKPLLRGKYIALCEGDDYWTDDKKLQKQFEIMENNAECSMCTHTILQINEDGTSTSKYRPSIHIDEGSIDTQSFLNIRRIYPFQTASYFMRSELWFSMICNPPAFMEAVDVGDEPMLLYMAAHGDIYYIAECMSVYRVLSVGSWSAKNKYNSEKRILRAEKTYKMMCLYNEYTNNKYDCKLALYKGDILWFSENYRELVKSEYNEYLKKSRITKRVFIHACALFPFIQKIRKLATRNSKYNKTIS